MKKCPYCAEEIQDEALLCKHCHSSLSISTTKPPTNYIAPSAVLENNNTSEMNRKYRKFSLIFCVISLISLFIPCITIQLSFRSGYDDKIIPISSFLGILGVFQINEAQNTSLGLYEGNPLNICLGITVIIGIVLFILSIIAIVNIIKAVKNRHKYVPLMEYCKTSIIFIITINTLAVLFSVICNSVINSSIESGLINENLCLVGYFHFPITALLFAIAGVIFVLLIANYRNLLLKATEKEKKQTNNASLHSHRVSSWTCKACGQSNTPLSTFCIECGTKK